MGTHYAAVVQQFVISARGQRVTVEQVGHGTLGRGKGAQINSDSLQSTVGGSWALPPYNRSQSFLLGKRRRSRVIGNSSLITMVGTGSFPGVWPSRKNRAMRRLSASLAFTGKLS